VSACVCFCVLRVNATPRRHLRKESSKRKKFSLKWCAFIDAEHLGVTKSPVQVGIGLGSVSHPRQLGWLLVYADAEAPTAQVRQPAIPTQQHSEPCSLPHFPTEAAAARLRLTLV
jgi:hypothetical protein